MLLLAGRLGTCGSLVSVAGCRSNAYIICTEHDIEKLPNRLSYHRIKALHCLEITPRLPDMHFSILNRRISWRLLRRLTLQMEATCALVRWFLGWRDGVVR